MAHTSKGLWSCFLVGHSEVEVGEETLSEGYV